MRAIIFLLASLSVLVSSGAAIAQTSASFVLCATASTGRIRATTRCTSAETQLSTANFARVIGVGTPSGTPTPTGTAIPGGNPAATDSADLSTCYRTSGTSRGSPQDGLVSVAVQCNRTTQVMLASEFSSVDKTNAAPSLESSTIIYSGNVPNGIQMSVRGATNKFFTLNVTAVCCDRN
jgi:hypothetical protein